MAWGEYTLEYSHNHTVLECLSNLHFQVSPYLGGIGISSAIVSFIVALYYNTIIAWCLIYFLHSFEAPLPWAECPKRLYSNFTYDLEPECMVSVSSSHIHSISVITLIEFPSSTEIISDTVLLVSLNSNVLGKCWWSGDIQLPHGSVIDNRLVSRLLVHGTGHNIIWQGGLHHRHLPLCGTHHFLLPRNNAEGWEKMKNIILGIILNFN